MDASVSRPLSDPILHCDITYPILRLVINLPKMKGVVLSAAILGSACLLMLAASYHRSPIGTVAPPASIDSEPETRGPINCRCIIRSGFGRLRDVWVVPADQDEEAPKVIGTLDCFRSDAVEFNVTIDAEFPLGGCPPEASDAALFATEQLMDKICEGDAILARLAGKNIVALSDGSPLLLKGADLLRSVDVSPEGVMSVSDRLAVMPSQAAERGGWSLTDDPIGEDRTIGLWAPYTPFLYVAWRERSPEGSLVFEPVFQALRQEGPELPLTTDYSTAPVRRDRVLESPPRALLSIVTALRNVTEDEVRYGGFPGSRLPETRLVSVDLNPPTVPPATAGKKTRSIHRP